MGVRFPPFAPAYLAFLVLVFVFGCSREPVGPDRTVRAGNPKRGKAIYLANCISCHNADPSRDGPDGPAIKGASRELLEARILRADYPPGYTPKRKTRNMRAYPYLKSAIPDLEAFLASAE